MPSLVLATRPNCLIHNAKLDHHGVLIPGSRTRNNPHRFRGYHTVYIGKYRSWIKCHGRHIRVQEESTNPNMFLYISNRKVLTDPIPTASDTLTWLTNFFQQEPHVSTIG